MKRIFVTFLALALCAAAFPLLFAGAQEGASRPRLSQRPEKTLDQLVRKYERLRLNPKEAARGVRASGRLSLSAPEHKFELELQPNDMRAPDYRAEETGEGGVRTLLASGPVRTYKGTVRGQAKAQARFTVDDETVEGMIITPEERYYVEPLDKFDPEAAATDFVLYKKSDVIDDPDQACGVTMDQEVGAAAKGVWQQLATTTGTTQAATPGMIYEAEIATEADYEYVTALGGSAAADAEIMSTMNQVDGVYEAELGVTFKLVYQHTWAGKGVGYPYTTTAVATDVLQQFTDYWNANFSNVQRDLAHIWTGKDLVDPNNDPNLIGISNIGTVCNSPVLAYAVSERMSSASQRAILAAHEIGHNFGATHVSGGDCTTTIMNPYLAGTRLTFCPGSRTQIATFLSTSASCLTEVCRPVISPAGQTFTAAGGAGSVSVTTGGSCAWTAKSNAPWIVINSGASGSGSKTVTYTVAPNTVATPRTGTLTVAGQTHTVMQAGAVLIKALTLNPANIPGGKKITGTVGLTAPAPAEGALVTLSDNLAATTVPASVTIPAGKLSAPFTITTVVTTTVQTGNVTASYNGSVVAAPLTVRPAVLTSFKLSTGSAVEGASVTATLTLDGAAPPAGAVVTLSDTLASALTPATFTIPSGYLTKSFAIPTKSVSATQTGVVTAKYSGVTINAPLSIRPNSVASLTLTPDAVVGGGSVQGLVTLEGNALTEVAVTLTENLANASVPPTVVIPVGARSRSFTVTTTAVTARQGGVVTASALGVSKGLALTIEKRPAQCTALTFATAIGNTLPSRPYALVTTDFNHDGKLDLAALNSNNVSVMLGSGAGTFGAPTNVVIQDIPRAIAAGDFNQDGNGDLAVPSGSNKVAILLGDGKGAFAAPAYFITGDGTSTPNSIAVGDFNNDGKLDLATGNSGTWHITVLPGDGSGGFGTALNSKAGTYGVTDLAAGDFNGDGKLDLAFTNGTQIASLILGNGAGGFGLPRPINLTTYSTNIPHEVAAGDFNKDGKQDLAFSTATLGVGVVIGDGLGGFGPQTLYTQAGTEIELLVLDMNGNGNQDLVLVNSSYLSVYLGTGTGTLVAPFSVFGGYNVRDVAAGDFDGDGRPDLAAADFSSSKVNVLLSTCQ
jgi:hypothetical protein